MSSAQTHIDLGLEFKNSGQYDQALGEFQAALHIEPTNDEAHHQIGLIYYFLGEFDDNVSWLEKAVTLNPSNLQARLDLALSYMSVLGDMDRFREQVQEVLRQDPANEEAIRHSVYF